VKPAVFHPEAEQEYLRSLEYYAGVSADLANRFDKAEVSRDPQRFFRFHPPVQRALSRKFPCSIVYLEQADRVWVVAVMHAKRRPGYWSNRLD